MEKVAPPPVVTEVSLDSSLKDSESRRFADMEVYGAPYHIHFTEGAEGYNLNPEGADHNLDASVMLTKMLRERITVTKKSFELPDELSWFSELYPDSDLNPDDLRKPSHVVRHWLLKMGPHNDMNDSRGDLRLAREWLIDGDESSQTNAGLIAEIDLELAELLMSGINDVTDQETDHDIDSEFLELCLGEAISYLQKSRDDYKEAGFYGKAALAQTKITSARLELRRLAITGTLDLKSELSDEQYHQLEEATLTELDELDIYILDGIKHTEETVSLHDSDEDIAKDKSTLKDVGSLFETMAYASMLTEMVVNEKLASAKIKTATLRQESGTSHLLPQYEQIADKRTRVKSFNFNYDLEYIELDDIGSGGKNKLKTMYIQNKIDDEFVKPQDAGNVSNKFFNGKNFVYQFARDFGIDVPDNFYENRQSFIGVTQGLRAHVRDTEHRRYNFLVQNYSVAV